MHHFVIDQLSREERQAVAAHLQKNAQAGPIRDIFWLPVPYELLSGGQKDHTQCGPFYLGIELGEDNVVFELLVRSQSTLHCSCIAHATNLQRQYLLDFVDSMVDCLHLRA